MTTAELIQNAKDCAEEALVLLDAAAALKSHPTHTNKADLLRSAGALLKVGGEEAIRAFEQEKEKKGGAS